MEKLTKDKVNTCFNSFNERKTAYKVDSVYSSQKYLGIKRTVWVDLKAPFSCLLRNLFVLIKANILWYVSFSVFI